MPSPGAGPHELALPAAPNISGHQFVCEDFRWPAFSPASVPSPPPGPTHPPASWPESLPPSPACTPPGEGLQGPAEGLCLRPGSAAPSFL